MEREILGSVYHKTSEKFMRGIYPIARTVKAEQHDFAVVEMEERRLGNIYGFDGGNYAGNVYDDEMLSPTIRTYRGGNQQPMIVTMRGRNPDNPSDRTAGSQTEQRLEPNSQGICNNNMVLVKQATAEGYVECECGGVADLSFMGSKTRRGRVQSVGNICTTITAESNGLCKIETQYRIRKLTPLECWRLMGFSDKDFYKAKEVNSNSQLYKQAGNSIVKEVLLSIFKQIL